MRLYSKPYYTYTTEISNFKKFCRESKHFFKDFININANLFTLLLTCSFLRINFVFYLKINKHETYY